MPYHWCVWVLCKLHPRSPLIITPINLVDVTLCIAYSLIVIDGISEWIGLHLEITSSCLVLLQFSHMRLSSDQSTASVAACWIWLSTADGRTYLPHSAVVHIFIYTDTLLCRSLMCAIKPGPSKVPWGTPALIVDQSETSSPILVRCSLSHRNEMNHFVAQSCTPIIATSR